MGDTAAALRRRLARNVRRRRLLSNLTQERLAEKAGTSVQHIGQVERGIVNVSIDRLARIAAALSVDVRDLLAAPRREPDATFEFTAPEFETMERLFRAARARHARAARQRA